MIEVFPVKQAELLNLKQQLFELEHYDGMKLLTDNTWGCSEKGDKIRGRMWTLRRDIELLETIVEKG